MTTSPSSLLVAVTGATGFIAGHTIAQLLARGHRVRATVRNPDNHAELAHLRALPGADRLELVAAELQQPGAFDAAVAGADAVLHMASPYVLDVADPQTDLVDPAVQGTLNVLASCARTPEVRRVVVTSSMAAVTDEPGSDRPLTEADWNTRSSLTRNPYYFSKVLAERAAWDFVRTQKPSWDLVVINPFLVIGPSLSPGLNTSNKIFVDLLGGAYPAIMDLTWGFVDVRDVATAHVRAVETPNASGRYLCAAETVSMRAVVDLLRSAQAPGKLPARGFDCAVGNQVVKMSSYFQPKGVGSYLRTHVGRVPRYDTSKIQRELGIAFRPVPETIRETIADLIRWKHLPATSARAA